MSEILQQLKHLSRHDLLTLIREATVLLEDEEDEELSPLQQAELDAAIDEYERDGNPGEEWSIVRARIFAQAQEAQTVAA